MTALCKCGATGYMRSSLGRVLCRACYDRHLYRSHWFVRSLQWKQQPLGSVQKRHPLPGQLTLFGVSDAETACDQR